MSFQIPAAYRLLSKTELKEFGMEGFVLEHIKSGARLILLPCSDTNKTFCIAFRTPPADDTGVPHILEHSVLCGSDRYPVKDPFVELMKSSLNTFLNAMTYPDKTVYPVSSCNDKDFKNLMDVYMDAVLHPCMRHEERIFRQEGWRYELESPEAPLSLNGVVYSEMKGVYSSPDEVLARYTQSSLFPDTAYGCESGGDPARIPDLSYEDFVRFHGMYYHPCNSYIYLYGNMDMTERLLYLDREYLSAYERISMDSRLKKQEPFGAMRTLELPYALEEGEENQGPMDYLSLQWAACDVRDSLTAEALTILETVLLDNPGAPLRQALLDSGICGDVSGSFDTEQLQPVFSVTGKLADASRRQEFLQVTEDCLRGLVQKGLNHTTLKAALARAEFSAREADFGTTPRGLVLALGILNSWLYDGEDPFAYVRFEDSYRILNERVEEGYFEQLIQECLLQNPHRSYVIMTPEPGRAAREEQALKAALAAKKASMSPEEIRILVEQGREFSAWQQTPDSPEALALIPRLSRQDISPEAEGPDNREKTAAGCLLLERADETVGIAYTLASFDMLGLTEEETRYAPLLRACFGEVDTARYGYAALNDELNLACGGYNLVFESPVEVASGRYTPRAVVSVKALLPRLKRSWELMGEMLFQADFSDKNRIREILDEQISDYRESLVSGGHQTAVGRAGAACDSRSAFLERMSGLDAYLFMKELRRDLDGRFPELQSTLSSMCRRLFAKERVIFSLTAGGEDLPQAEAVLAAFAKTLPAAQEDRLALPEPTGRREALSIAGAVGYHAVCGHYQSAGPYTGALRVLSTMLRSGYLWQQLRVKGGAYGAMCRFPMSGPSYLTSYRDPQLEQTYRVYAALPEYLKTLELSEEELKDFIIASVGTMDTPLTPSLKGDRDFRLYLSGVTGADLQRERNQVLGCTLADLRALSPYMEAILNENCCCSVGPAQALKDAAGRFDSQCGLL